MKQLLAGHCAIRVGPNHRVDFGKDENRCFLQRTSLNAAKFMEKANDAKPFCTQLDFEIPLRERLPCGLKVIENNECTSENSQSSITYAGHLTVIPEDIGCERPLIQSVYFTCTTTTHCNRQKCARRFDDGNQFESELLGVNFLVLDPHLWLTRELTRFPFRTKALKAVRLVPDEKYLRFLCQIRFCEHSLCQKITSDEEFCRFSPDEENYDKDGRLRTLTTSVQIFFPENNTASCRVIFDFTRRQLFITGLSILLVSLAVGSLLVCAFRNDSTFVRMLANCRRRKSCRKLIRHRRYHSNLIYTNDTLRADLRKLNVSEPREQFDIKDLLYPTICSVVDCTDKRVTSRLITNQLGTTSPRTLRQTMLSNPLCSPVTSQNNRKIYNRTPKAKMDEQMPKDFHTRENILSSTTGPFPPCFSLTNCSPKPSWSMSLGTVQRY
ncbi:hypothetical protein PHET_08311 [Paragonimus heterotremus]|uniref:ZP domain-containing protein n=1 Tax=Paragonimus heterotremus TaxID=100268 RepID=A0A8J4SI06_9TREM|nr:hypothetical protein PHET_08311 [Paragonimus heterotremus]